MAVNTREKLLDVARQLIMKQGLEHTTMNDIASASDKGRRTIYTYFRNKKEIYNAVLERETDRLVAQLRGIAEQQSTAPDKLRAFLLKRLEQGATVGSPYAAIKALFKFDLRRMERVRRMVHDKENALYRAIIAEGIAAGQFDAGRCERLNSFLVRCVQGMDLAEIDAADRGRLAKSQQAFVDFVLESIVTKDTEPDQSSQQ